LRTIAAANGVPAEELQKKPQRQNEEQAGRIERSTKRKRNEPDLFVEL
jgi:hypothetical protein